MTDGDLRDSAIVVVDVAPEVSDDEIDALADSFMAALIARRDALREGC